MILNSIEVLDTEYVLNSYTSNKSAWRLLNLTLPFNAYELFVQQIDSGKLLILGGKSKKSKTSSNKAYLCEINTDQISEQFTYTLNELQEIPSKKKFCL